jgi:hypothetical protein
VVGQVAGEFYLDKTSFARFEPVFLNYRITNKGLKTVTVDRILNPERPCCSAFSIKVSNDPVPMPSCPFVGDGFCSCDGQYSVPLELRAGEAYTERFLLNFGHEIGDPGDYWVEAVHFGPVDRTKLSFRVEGNTIAPTELQPWLDGLKSASWEKRTEAARTLASLAPPFLQETLLGFVENPEFRRYAPLALHRLNTPRSMDAMAQLMEGPDTNEQMGAAHYLALTGDERWYPLLRDAAVENAGDSAYPTYAAELGGDKALAMLIALAKSPDREPTGGNAIMAMGSTGSRDAIPVLLGFLNDPDTNISDSASYALRLLTHRTVIRDSLNWSRQTESTEWLQWWKREGATAPIYKDTQCGEMTPLP